MGSETIVNEKVNSICSEFVKTYDNIDKIVAEFDENDKSCWFWNKPDDLWFDRHRLRQLLTYVKDHRLTDFTVHVYKAWDGGRGRGRTLGEMSLDEPKQNENDLDIYVLKPIPMVRKVYGNGSSLTCNFSVMPERFTFSGGQYINTRADITNKTA
jgi:hypothetical protein